MAPRRVMNFPEKFGFVADLRECVGKTIERVEMVQMDYGCTWPQAFAVRFTDGTRAFFGATVGTGIMNPRLDGTVCRDTYTVETSQIFTKPEYAAMADARRQDAVRREQDREREERRQFERLTAKFATDRQ